MICKNCNNTIPDFGAFCPICGCKLTSDEPPMPNPNPIPTPPPMPNPNPIPTPPPMPNPNPIPTPPPMPNPNPNPTSSPKQGDQKKVIIIASVFAGVILVLTLILAIVLLSRQKTYKQGMTQFENGKYTEAVQTFSSLKGFKNSREMAEYAQEELDYLELDNLAAEHEFDKICEILGKRVEFHGDDSEGKDAEKLLNEYDMAGKAFAAKDNEDYRTAAKRFDKLDILRDTYVSDLLLCRAYEMEEDNRWNDVLKNLYAMQTGDSEYQFLDNPQNEDDRKAAKAYSELDGALYDEVLKCEGEAAKLKENAQKGLRYDEAATCIDERRYSQAYKIFEELGDFLDSAERMEEAEVGMQLYEEMYKEAKEYYDNGEFYKARLMFMALEDYEDAEQMSESCVQDLPENGSLKTGNGSISLSITAPSGEESIYVKVYDTNGDVAATVFIRPEKKATVKLKSGTYTIKIAYGTEWYGEVDLFGDMGIYSQLLNGTEEEFKLSGGYSYDLKLRTVENGEEGNVGSEYLDGAAGM